MTHRDLVKQARKWLKIIGKCKVVITEKASSYEICDALGFKSAHHSILIECKTSRADFRADAKKWFRKDGYGMGQQRYFLAPKNIIPREELPIGWGLLEIDNNTIKTVVECDLLYMDERVTWAEMPLLISVIRKLQYQNSKLRKQLRRH
jgi:DNA repair protein MmcB-like